MKALLQNKTKHLEKYLQPIMTHGVYYEFAFRSQTKNEGWNHPASLHAVTIDTDVHKCLAIYMYARHRHGVLPAWSHSRICSFRYCVGWMKLVLFGLDHKIEWELAGFRT